ncbi:MAG: Na+/proline symporter, partial [Candidatus Midichloriaceae bacterium]
VLMSTVDSWLNCTSSIVVKDFLRTMLPKMSDTQELRSVRIVTFIISGIAMMIALYSQEIMTVFYGAMNFWYPVIFIPFVAGVLGFKTKSASFVCGAIVAVLTCAIAALLTNELGLISLAIATASNAIGFFGYHYYYCQTKKVHTVL